MDTDPTRTEHFRQWAASGKVDPARCRRTAQPDRTAVSSPRALATFLAGEGTLARPRKLAVLDAAVHPQSP